MRLRAWAGLVSCVLLQLLVPFARAGAETDTATVQGRVTLSVSGARVSQLGPVVVYFDAVDGKLEFPVPREVPKVRQRNAEFSPRFRVVVVGQTVEMLNDDAIYHNVFSYSRPNDFDLGIYPAGQSRSVTFAYPGVVKTYCSFHESMNGTILVAPTPHFDIVGPSGAFAIRGVPAGRYRLKTWNERLPETSREITLAPGSTISLEISLAQTGL